jgi:serine/threonine protein phosphatase PrpC
VEALPGIFQRLADGLYHALTESEELVVDKLRAGTTATLALLSPTHLIVASVGDSRGVLCRGGQAVPLTRQHRPDDPEELDRIRAAGGRVTFVGVPRVDGQLAMTRAIGAFHLADQGVIAEPDISVHAIDASQDAFLVLGTDGLFDVVRDEEVVATVMACDSVSEAASALSDLALAYGTRDNVTAMVVALPAWDELFAVPEVASRNHARRAN